MNYKTRRTLLPGGPRRWAVAPLLGLAALYGAARGAERVAVRPDPDTSAVAAPPAPPPAAPAVSGVELLDLQAALPPAGGPLDPAALRKTEAAVRAGVAGRAFPGAALAVGRGGEVVLERGFGQVAWGEGMVDPMTTRYDLASLTKVVATTTAVMLLVEDGRMALDAPVSRYLPQFRSGNRSRVTIRHLLSHTSGLPAGSGGRSLSAVLSTPLTRAPGARMVYSDVGMVVLWEAAARASAAPLPALLERRVWKPLGMSSTGFAPGTGCAACAPTGRGSGFRGRVHDPIARRLGGVAGNAGLFSTAHDLGRFAAMLAGGGAVDGVRVLRPETVRGFLRRQPGARSRALGWDTGRAAPGRARPVWHTGFTGTSLWVDPEQGTWAVLLTNRTLASARRNPLPRLRRQVHGFLARAATDEPGGGTASDGRPQATRGRPAR